jgi:putative hemolysin
MFLLIISMLIALSISFVCSIMEACLLSLSNADIARIAEKRPRAAQIWKNFKSNIHKPIALILIVNTFAHTIGASVAGAQFNALYGPKWIGLFSILLSFAMIQWTEILPKTIGVRHNKKLASITAFPMKALLTVLKPVISLTEFLNRPFEKSSTTKENAGADITVLAHSAALENQISKQQERLITSSIQLSTRKAKDIMVPRESINTLDISMSLSDALIASHVHHHTRFPLVINNNIDQIAGYVNFKDIVGALHLNPINPTMDGIKRTVVFVNDDTKLQEVLLKLTRGYQHMAIVRNKKGATVGLITLEDLTEMLVGEIVDEYDHPPEMFVQLSETRFRAGGSLTLRQLKERAFSGMPDLNITLDKWIKGNLKGAQPVEGQQFQFDDFVLTVRRVTKGNVYDCIIDKKTRIPA